MRDRLTGSVVALRSVLTVFTLSLDYVFGTVPSVATAFSYNGTESFFDTYFSYVRMGNIISPHSTVKAKPRKKLVKQVIKNEVGCRDDTVPKTVDTRRHCEEE